MRSWRAFLARGRALATAAVAVRLPAACQFLTFGVTLASWPGIPGAACTEGVFGSVSQGWWFTLVVATYNALDFAARLHLPRMQRAAQRLNGRACVLAALMRAVLPMLIYVSVRPRWIEGGAGNAVILFAVSALALSNGLLATATMMQVGSSAPPGLSEEAVYVAVAATYAGLASGATVSSYVANQMMQLQHLQCSA